jgi:AcrR family transcriptional regulator
MGKRQSTEIRQIEIAEAALKIIASSGLREFTVSSLAAEVGIAEGTIFRHFRNKKEIVLAAINRLEEVIFEGFPPEDEDPLERLGHFFIKRIGLISSRPEMSRIMFSDQILYAAGEEGIQKVRAMQKRNWAFIRACLQEAAQKGILKEGLSGEDLFIIVHGAISSLLALSRISGLERPPIDHAASVWATLQKLIRRQDHGK